jgi:group I intron endonuclease
MYVYQITNNINGKIYIGITNNHKRRWQNECSKIGDPKRRQAITNAIQKYGKENFTFEVLYEGISVEEASELEIKLIQEKNSLVPNGYNVAKGGMYTMGDKAKYGSDNANACLTQEEAQYIKDHRNIPIYLLYEEFSDKISYEAFRKCYNHQTYTNLTPSVECYPYNTEFSNQFCNKGNALTYEEVIDLRKRYANGEYWKDVYKDYKNRYTNEMSFWNVYNGRSYKLVMPEVFTEENKKKHSSLKASGSRNPKAKLTEDDVRYIRKKHEQGMTNKELYTLYPSVSTTTIRDIINYKTWKNVTL